MVLKGNNVFLGEKREPAEGVEPPTY